MSSASQPISVEASWHPERAVTDDYSGRSNLALAFLCLPRDKRADMNVFYTFCRLVDDIADSPTLPPAEKTALLESWRAAIHSPPRRPVDRRLPADSIRVADALHELTWKYSIPPEHLVDIIDGVEMDIVNRQYETFEQLRAYCYRVASVVGLVSIEIFGYRDVATRQYAVDLGMALQLTNIIRDVAVDLENGGRIYLPLEDLARFGYTPADLRNRVYDERFQALMAFEAHRAEGYYRSANSHLSSSDRKTMVAAEIMKSIYHRLLAMIESDRYRVFERRYRLTSPSKLWILLVAILRNGWA